MNSLLSSMSVVGVLSISSENVMVRTPVPLFNVADENVGLVVSNTLVALAELVMLRVSEMDRVRVAMVEIESVMPRVSETDRGRVAVVEIESVMPRVSDTDAVDSLVVEIESVRPRVSETCLALATRLYDIESVIPRLSDGDWE